jgi:hypothetical protein
LRVSVAGSSSARKQFELCRSRSLIDTRHQRSAARIMARGAIRDLRWNKTG